MRFQSFGNMLQNFFLFWFLSQTKKSWGDPEIVKNLEPDIEFKSNSKEIHFYKNLTYPAAGQWRLQNKSNVSISKLISAICNCSD